MAVTIRTIWQDLRETASRYAEITGRPLIEVALTEPGLQALAVFRVSHWLHGQGLTLWARLVSQHGRRFTGIDVHPGARIGRRCLLWQGGVVVGEGSVVGDDCTLEGGAMLLGPAGGGHPRLGDRVLVEAGAILSGEVYIGHDVRVLAGAVVTRDIPDGGVAVGVPGRVLSKPQAKPDPDARATQALAERLYHLEEQVQVLAFATRQQSALGERWRTRQPDQYGPIPAVEELLDGAGI